MIRKWFMHPMSSGKISFSHFLTNLIHLILTREERSENIVDKSTVKYGWNNYLQIELSEVS